MEMRRQEAQAGHSLYLADLRPPGWLPRLGGRLLERAGRQLVVLGRRLERQDKALSS